MPSGRIKSVHFSPHFFKSFQRLPRAIQAQAKKKDEWFRQNPFDPRLHTHKLKGPPLFLNPVRNTTQISANTIVSKGVKISFATS